MCDLSSPCTVGRKGWDVSTNNDDSICRVYKDSCPDPFPSFIRLLSHSRFSASQIIITTYHNNLTEMTWNNVVMSMIYYAKECQKQREVQPICPLRTHLPDRKSCMDRSACQVLESQTLTDPSLESLGQTIVTPR